MNYFTIIEGAHCIVRNNGIFRQCKVYRGGEGGLELFAAVGTGFIKLTGEHSTSHPKMYLVDIDCKFKKGKFGYLIYDGEMK